MGAITERQLQVLKAVSAGTYERGINAKALSWTLWGNSPQGGYLAGTRKGWLCAGSLVGKLRKAGYVDYDRECIGYRLTEKGRRTLKDGTERKS